MPFREWDFSFRELFSELRELLREYPRTLPEPWEWPFRSESVFPESGVVPRLLRTYNWGAANGGLRDGVYANLRISEEKGLFPPFSGFPRCSSYPPEKGEKGRKRAKKGDFGRFPGRAARHPLSPHLLHPHLRQPNVVHVNSWFVGNIRKIWLIVSKALFHSTSARARHHPTARCGILRIAVQEQTLVASPGEINISKPEIT